VTCDLAAMTCSASEPAPPEAGLLPSPDGKRVALIRSYNLVVRDVATGRETRLTADGAEHHAYASLTEGTRPRASTSVGRA
jgi:hypothetical protein